MRFIGSVGPIAQSSGRVVLLVSVHVLLLGINQGTLIYLMLLVSSAHLKYLEDVFDKGSKEVAQINHESNSVFLLDLLRHVLYQTWL